MSASGFTCDMGSESDFRIMIGCTRDALLRLESARTKPPSPAHRSSSPVRDRHHRRTNGLVVHSRLPTIGSAHQPRGGAMPFVTGLYASITHSFTLYPLLPTIYGTAG